MDFFDPLRIHEKQVLAHHERNVKQEKKKHLARQNFRRGMTLFEYNKATGVLRKAEFEEVTVNVKTGARVHKVIHQDNCMYFQKLNFKNAVKFLTKHGVVNINILKQ